MLVYEIISHSLYYECCTFNYHTAQCTIYAISLTLFHYYFLFCFVVVRVQSKSFIFLNLYCELKLHIYGLGQVNAFISETGQEQLAWTFASANQSIDLIWRARTGKGNNCGGKMAGMFDCTAFERVLYRISIRTITLECYVNAAQYRDGS